jgi:hypothetical protein
MVWDAIEPRYHFDYIAFRRLREKYEPCDGVTDAVVKTVCQILETHGGWCWLSFQHKTTWQKLIILYLETIHRELRLGAPKQIGDFKIVPWDHQHAQLG